MSENAMPASNPEAMITGVKNEYAKVRLAVGSKTYFYLFDTESGKFLNRLPFYSETEIDRFLAKL